MKNHFDMSVRRKTSNFHLSTDGFRRAKLSHLFGDIADKFVLTLARSVLWKEHVMK